MICVGTAPTPLSLQFASLAILYSAKSVPPLNILPPFSVRPPSNIYCAPEDAIVLTPWSFLNLALSDDQILTLVERAYLALFSV